MNDISGIKKRWFINYTLIILVVFIIIEGFFLVGLNNFYHKNAYNLLVDRANVTVEFYKKYYDTDLYNIEEISQLLINNYTDQEIAEIQILDLDGNVLKSSNEFLIDEKSSYPEGVEDGIVDEKYMMPGTGEKVISVYVPLKNSAGTVIGILKYTSSLTLIDASINRLFTYSLGLLALLILILSVLSFFFTRTLINPIESIISATEKLAKGDYNTRVAEDFKDEMQTLAISVNQMAEKIQESEKSKNEFISSITHEIRTPLTSIKGWSETIITGDMNDKEEIEVGLGIIIRETERLSFMVEELLEFSKLEAGNLKIFKEKVEIVMMCEDIISLYKGKFNKKNIEGKIVCDQGSVYLKVDSNRIRQVIINILENAYKFSDYDSEIIINICELKDQVIIKIVDFGIGISDKNLKKVLNKFFKSDSKHAGSGLGLSISNEIVKLHGGYIDIKSQLHEGTEVSIILPK
ncbi:MAG TPA: HAMP domain-containing sensor histidine kinase [Clostridia bacterium]|nr:HAMP domain-containing sensor histidine kinase [Clostridia bacterium]